MVDPSDDHVTEVELSPIGSPPPKPWGHRHGAMAVVAVIAGAVLISGASGGGHALSTSELADFAGPELPDDRDSDERRVIVREEYGRDDDTTERDSFSSDEMAIEVDDPTTTLDPLLVDPWVPPEYDTFPPEDEVWDGPSYPTRTVPPRRTTPPRTTVPPRRTTTTTSATTTTSTSTTTSTTTTTIAPGTGTTSSSSSTSTSSTIVNVPGLPTTTTTTIPFCHETTTTTTTTTTFPLGITIPTFTLPPGLTTTTTTPPCATTTTTSTTTTLP